MWRSATKNVCNVPGGTALAWSAIEDIAPISGLYKRFVENRAAASRPATPSGQPAVPFLDQPSIGTPSAAQLAFAEWSRQADVHKTACERDPLTVMPLGSQPDQQQQAATSTTVLGSFWQQEQQLPVLQTVIQEPCSSHQGSAAAAAAPSAVNSTGLVQTGELQGQAGLAGEPPATTAGAAALAAAALLENMVADDILITRPIPQRISPFMLSAPAALPSAGLAAGPGDSMSTQHGGPFPGVLLPAWDAAQHQQQLHAPAVLPEFRLAGPQTLAGGLGPAAAPCTPPSSPEAVALQDIPGLTSATIAAAGAMGTDPVSTWPTGGAGAPAAFCLQQPAAPQTCCNTAGSTPGGRCSAGTTQYCSPFSLMAPWGLNALAADLVAAAGGPGVQDAGDVLLQGLWRIEQPISRLAGRAGAGSNVGRVVKRQGKAREHSSVKQRKLLKELQGRHAALLEEYEGYLALNATLQQHWADVAAAAAAAGVPEEAAAAPSSTAAAEAVGALDGASATTALAELVHHGWTSVLVQMVQLLPFLGGVASQDQQQEQVQFTPAATRCTAATLTGAYQPDSALSSPFVAAAAAAGDVAGGCSATGVVNAESRAALQLSLPLSCLLSDVLSPLPAKTQSGQPDQEQTGSGRNGLKRRHKGPGAESQHCTEQLSLLLSTNLSLGPPNAKQPRLSGGDSLVFTESELRAIFSLGSGQQPQQQQLLPVSVQDQQVSMGQDRVAGQQQQGGDVTQGLSSSPASALQSATSLYGVLCELFERLGLAGPSLLYRCFGPKATSCPCCSPAEVPAVLGQSCAAGGGVGCTELQEGPAGASGQHQLQDQSLLALLLAGDDSVGGAAMVEGVAEPVRPACYTYATPAHWQQVVDSLSLTPEQETCLAQLWAGVQRSHSICFDSRQQLLHALQQQQEASGGWPGVAAYGSCQAGEAVAAQAEQLLVDVSDTLAADYGLLLDTSKRLWGDKSPLTLVQKVKCLVNSHPFWPDYDLLACMASSRTATA